MVVSNAVWICGLAVILAAFGWYDYKRRELKERNSSFRRDSFMKPVLLGLIMVAGGGALSVRGPLPAVLLAIAALGLVAVFVKRFFLGRAKSAVDDEERRRRARSAAGQGASGLGDLSANHDKYLAEACAEDEKNSK